MFFYSQPEFYFGNWNLIYQEDFETTPQGLTYYNNSIIGSAGQLVEHSSLATPLTQNGTYCWNIPQNNSNLQAGVETNTIFSENVQKAVSVRAWMRSEWDGFSVQGIVSRLSFNQWVPNAYSLVVYQEAKWNGYSNDYAPRISLAGKVMTDRGQYDIYTWKQLRMDVIPGTQNGTSADKLVAYINTDENSENWIQILETTILSTDGSYIPWNINKYIGGVYIRDGSSAGNTYNTYFDKLQVYIADI